LYRKECTLTLMQKFDKEYKPVGVATIQLNEIVDTGEINFVKKFEPV